MNPQRVGRYRIEGVLGSGAMGIVYRAFDPGVGRAVAIKTVRKELLDGGHPWNAVERFRREARSAGRLSHPNIVTVHDFGEDESSAYLVCEFVDGVPLDRWLATQGRPDWPLRLAWMGQLLTALAYAHGRGVVHRDVKAANLLVAAGRQLKLADFGIAQLDASDLTQGGLMLGTPSCMAPEQILRLAVDGRADVFAAGVLLYHLLTGTRPFAGSPEQAMQQILEQTPVPPSQVDPAVPAVFDAVVARALAKRPDRRYGGAGEFLSALLDAARAAGVAGVPPAGGEAAVAPDPDRTLLLPRRAGQATGLHRSAESPTALAASASAARLAGIEDALRSHVGPIARVLVRQSAARCSDIGALVARLAPSIPDVAARAAFVAAAGLAPANAGGTRGGVAAIAGTSLRGGLTRATGIAPVAGPTPSFGGGVVTNGAGSPRATLDDATISRVRDRLALLIGPMASVAVRRALRDTDTVHGLVERAAAQVSDGGARRRFLAEFGVSSPEHRG